MTTRIALWMPRSAAWWIANLFIVGSACFALGAFPPYAAWAGATADCVTYFVGSLFFTTAAALQCRQPADVVARAAALVQLAGTLLFNRSTFQALHQNISATEADRHVWRPDVLGSLAFLVASALAIVAVQRLTSATERKAQSPPAWLNMAGSVAFGVSAAASYVISDSDTLRNAQLANLGTFVGALCFLTGAALILPRKETPAVPVAGSLG